MALDQPAGLRSLKRPQKAPAGQNKNKWGGWLVVLLVLALAGGGGLIAYRQYNQQTQARLTQKAQTVAAGREDIQLKVSASGTIQPLQSVNISPKTPGRVLETYVKEGQKVERGQTLARIDSSNLQGQLLQTQGQLAAAEAALQKAEAGLRPQEVEQALAGVEDAQAGFNIAQSNYEQDLKLFSEGAISERIVENSRATRDRSQAQLNSAKRLYEIRRLGSRREDISAARAQVMVARGNVQTIRTQINDTILIAPFSGTITRIYADPGSIVSPNTPSSNLNSSISSSVMNLAGELVVKTNVAETDVTRIRVGQTVKVHADAYPGKTFSAQVRQIAPQSTVIQNVTSFEVKATLIDPQESLLRGGMSIDADFVTGDIKGALLIPTVAIVRQQGATGVFIKKDNQDKPTFQAITTGFNIDSRTQVTSGLKVGDQVYISFPPGFRPNTTSGSLPGSSLRGTVR